MIGKIFVSLLCLAIGSTASAAKWYYIDGTPSYAMMVDVDSIETNGNTKAAWVLYATKHLTDGVLAYSVLWNEIDCKHKKYLVGDTFFYSELGKSLGYTKGSYQWSKIPPSSVSSEVYRCVCKNEYRDNLISDQESTLIAYQRLMLTMIFNDIWQYEPKKQ